MISPVRLNAVDCERCIKCEGETKKLKEKSKPDTGTPFQETAECQGDEIGRDEDKHRPAGSLGFEEPKHLAENLTANGGWGQVPSEGESASRLYPSPW